MRTYEHPKTATAAAGERPGSGAAGLIFHRLRHLFLLGVLAFLVLAACTIFSPASSMYVEGDTTTWIRLIRQGVGEQL